MIAAVELDDAGFAMAGKPVKIMIRSPGRVVYLMLPLVSSADTMAEPADS